MNMKKVNGVRRCRLCACEEDFHGFSHIFDDNPEMELEMKITKLLPIVVMPWDPMSHLVCHKCIEKLNYFNDFYDTSLKAERFLRTLQPSAPQTDIERLSPVVEVMDAPILTKSPLKLPLKKRQGMPPLGYKAKKDHSPEYVDTPPSTDEHQEDVYPKRTLNCFIINQISNRDSVFTCRECFRTFTKQSSALTHSCVRIEDCAEIETIDVDDEAEKSLPPLKIRLFSVRSGLFVCYICQAPFEEKAEVIEHIRGHILEGGKKTGRGKATKRRGRSLEGSLEDEGCEETCKKKAVRRKRKKCSGPPKKRGRPKTGETAEECQSGTCAKCGGCQDSLVLNSLAKETVERTTQYSEVSENSEDEPQKEEEIPEQQTETPPRLLETTANPEFCRMQNTAEKTKQETETPPRFMETTSSPEFYRIQNAAERTKQQTETPPRFMETRKSAEYYGMQNNIDTHRENPEQPNLSNLSSPYLVDDFSRISEPEEEPPISEPENISDEVTVLEVIKNKTPTNFSSCVFCDKIFATKEALISHQNKHLQGVPELKAELEEKKVLDVALPQEETFLCSICAMIFTNKKTLMEHEQYHLVDMDSIGCQRKIRIALNRDFADGDREQECQISKGKGVITITVTTGENKIPQIELI